MDMKIIKLKVKIVVEKDDDSFHAYCPDLKGLHAEGETRAQAVDNAVEAVTLYLESLIEHEEPMQLIGCLKVGQ